MSACDIVTNFAKSAPKQHSMPRAMTTLSFMHHTTNQFKSPMAGYYLSSSKFLIKKMANALKLMNCPQSCEKVHPSELDHALETHTHMYPHLGAPFSPVYPTVGNFSLCPRT
jgi:hypothetical protein